MGEREGIQLKAEQRERKKKIDKDIERERERKIEENTDKDRERHEN